MISKSLLLFVAVGIISAFALGTYLIDLKNSNTLEYVEGPSISIATDKVDFKRGESITIHLINSGSVPIIFSDSSYGLKIIDLVGMKIYSPLAIQVITTLEPKQEVTFVWDQTKNDGSPVIQGVYKIEFHGADESGNKIQKLHTINIF